MNSKPEKEVFLEYEILRVQVLEYSFGPDNATLIPGNQYKQAITVNHHVPEGLKSLEVRVQAVAFSNSTTTAEKLYSIQTLCIFDVSGLEHTRQGDGVILPQEMLRRLAVEATATTRGILIAKNFATNVDRLLLPVLPDNMASLKSSDPRFAFLKIGELNWPPTSDQLEKS
jgi:hypothetical protein